MILVKSMQTSQIVDARIVGRSPRAFREKYLNLIDIINIYLCIVYISQEPGPGLTVLLGVLRTGQIISPITSMWERIMWSSIPVVIPFVELNVKPMASGMMMMMLLVKRLIRQEKFAKITCTERPI